MSEEKEENKEMIEKFFTPGGIEAIQVGDMTIRQSHVGRRLIEDDETYDEYRLRQKLLKKHSKLKQMFHISSMYRHGQIIKNPNPYVKDKELKK